MNRDESFETGEVLYHTPYQIVYKPTPEIVKQINKVREAMSEENRKITRLKIFSELYGMDSKKLYAYVSGASAGHNFKGFVQALQDFTIGVVEKDYTRKEGEVASIYQPVNPYFKKESWSKK